MSPAADRVALSLYQPGDAQQVKAFVLAIIEGEFQLTYRRKDLEAIDVEYAPPGCFILLRELDDGELVGTAGLSLAPKVNRPLPQELDCPAEALEPLGILRRMYLAPPWRGKGLGRLLYSRIEEQARKANCRALYLDTDPSMRTARRFYLRCGFQPLSRALVDPGPFSEGCLHYMVKVLDQQP